MKLTTSLPWAAAALVTLAFAGCAPDTQGAPCTADGNNCPTGQVCVVPDGETIGKCRASNTGGGTGGGATGGGTAQGGGAAQGGGGGADGGGAGTGGGATGGGTTGGGTATGGGDPMGGGTTGGGTTGGGGATGGGTTGGGTTGGGTTGGGGGTVNDGGISGAPSSHDFGSTEIRQTGSSFAFTITNDGSAPTGTVMAAVSGTDAPSFSIGTNTCTGTIGPGGNCSITIIFTPRSLGALTASLDVSGMPGGMLSLGLTGTGLSSAALSVSPMTGDFMNVVVGSVSMSQLFTVTNTGGVPSSTPMVALTGANSAEFILSSNTCVAALAPMGTCTFRVSFAPSSPGSKSAIATATITNGSMASASLSGTGLSQAALSGMPSTGAFNPTVQNTDSTPIVFTITNTGQATSPMLNATISGVNAADFVKSADGCTGTAVPGSMQCQVTVTFHPTATGGRNGTLTISGMGLVPVVIPLGGNGQTPAQLSMSPVGNVNFGDVANNASQSLSFGITNTGQGTASALMVVVTGAQFGILTNNCGTSLAGGANCDVVVRFAPGSNGVKTGTLTVSGTPGGSQVANLTGNGVSPGALSVTPATFDYGNVVQGSSSGQQVFTVTNTGGVPTGTPGAMLVGTGQGFSITGNTCSAALLPSGTCTFTVVFAPLAPTRNTQSVLLQVSASPGGTDSASLTGTALTPAALSVTPGTASFPDTTVMTTSGTIVTLNVSNTGDQATGGLSITRSASDFTITPQTGDCASGAPLAGLSSCTVHVSFTPQASGARSGNVTVSGTPGGMAVTTFSGNGLSAANLAFSGSGAFGNVVIPNTTNRTITVTNSGQSTSGAVTYGTASPFSIVAGGTCVSGNTLAPGAMCTLNVQFTAAPPNGMKTASLTASATPGGTPSLTLTANAQNAASLSANFSSNNFGGVEVGQSAIFDWIISNPGDVATPTLSTTALSGMFSIVSDSCNGQAIAPMGSCTVRIRYTPTGGGNHAASTTVSGGTLSTGLSLSGSGMWRLTLTPNAGGVTGTLDGNIAGCTSTSGTSACTALYAQGAAPTVRSTTSNGSGFFFANYTAPTACTNFGRGRDCAVSMTAHTTVSPNFMAIDANLAFVSSVNLPANLGGVAPYDALCNFYASDAGINNTAGTNYVAWMSTSASSATSRLTATGGARRMDGAPFMLSKADLIAGRVRNPIALDERGQLVPAVAASLWTGTNSMGTTNNLDCSGWTSASSAQTLNRGLVFGGPDLWTNDTSGGHTCNNGNTRILCMGKGSNAFLSTPSAPSGSKKLVLVGPVARPSSVANADSTCAASLSGSKAILAATGTSARSWLSDATVYVRFDNTVIGTGAEIKASNPVPPYNPLRAGIWQTVTGTFVATASGIYAWTGGSGVAPLDASTCTNWQSASGSVELGLIQTAATNFMAHNGTQTACMNQYYLYCAEQ